VSSIENQRLQLQKQWILRGALDSPVTVHARGGELRIAWAGAGRAVLMSGPAQAVFEGEIELS